MSLPLSKVLVIGAGELGLEVLRSLSEEKRVKQGDTKVTVLLRPSASSSSKDTSAIERLGCSTIRHDISTLDENGLAGILQHYDAVVSCTGFAAGSGTQLKITRATIAAKVKRFFPWQFGVDYDAIGHGSGQNLFDEQLEVRSLLQSQTNVDWIIVSTGIFMSFVFEDVFGVVVGATDASADAIYVRALGAWENGLTVTAVEDIGRLTAGALFDSSIGRQVIYTAGDTFTYDSLATAVQRVTGKQVHKELWDRRHLMEDLNVDPDNTILKYRVAFAAGKGVMWDKAASYNESKGVSVTDVETWLAQHVKR
ncbi:hypothetical protein CAC42_4269 [Sphaceloma murrayae]|uniref:NmrA-like domain-containing protein n=1 Tax=Sphaceloma murrayae TaxID=2082308 RepID=A0A2K1QKZ3_9PEZI|nr:hypothetical protein CAC42_4269 [Sphaceloma murrayae]